MIKKMLAVTALSLLSLSANAGYIQYNFNDGGFTGYFVQRDDNKAIAYYNLTVRDAHGTTNFTPQGYLGDLVEAANYFNESGPTGFRVFVTNPTGTTFDRLRVGFEPGNPSFAYAAAFEHQVPNAGDVDLVKGTLASTYFSIVTKSTVDSALVAQLDANGGYAMNIRRITSVQRVPEPGSLALLSLGLFALSSLRRKTQSK